MFRRAEMKHPGQRPDGGRIAARGFQYQYLRTLEYLLEHIDDPDVASIRVEGPSSIHGMPAQAIDFDVISADGHCLLAAQVKSKASSAPFSASQAFKALVQLLSAGEALTYCLFTNGHPAPTARRLAHILSAPGEPTRLRDEIASVLSGAPDRLAELKALSMTKIERLTRCRVLFDDRDETEVREILREHLRRYRNQARSGLGQESAGMLTGYLVSEILRRAADADEAIFTVEQLRSHLLISAEDLARANGARDWGITVGAVPDAPDITRPKLLDSLVWALSWPETSQVQRAALIGPSGIGKSSMAAAYIADRADSYDWIFWVDCESEESILTSFRYIAAFLSGNETGVNYHDSPTYLRQAVHTGLSRAAGRWLMIFDNVTYMRQADSWIPRVGTGHVIITSIDSVARHGTADIIDVGVMELSEATELLCHRFKLDTSGLQDYQDALCSLATELSCWPLALELASGYMDSCGIGLDGVSHYLDQLKMRSLADPDSVPPAYPRTLVAAVSLCLDRLNDRIGIGGGAGGHAYVALGVITHAAFLASRQLPCHMLAAAVLIDPPPESGPGIYVIDPSMINVGEVVRELRRFSLTSFDRDLPDSGEAFHRLHDLKRTITVNAVTQEIIRAELEESQGVRNALNCLANHVDRWLMAALELNRLEQASALFPHAEMLARHIRRLGVADRRGALLCGNLAGAYRARGEIAKAGDYLRAELDIVQSISDSNDILMIQAKLQLADMYFDDSKAVPIDLMMAVSYMEEVAGSARDIGITYPDAAMKLAMDAKTTLNRPAARAAKLEMLGTIEQQLDGLASEIGPTEYSEVMLAIRKASNLMDKGRVSMVERLCLRALGSGAITGSAELEARRLLVEAFVHERRWREALEAHRAFRLHFGSTQLFSPIIIQYAHNVGLACASPALSEGVVDGIPLLNEILGWPVISEALEGPTTGTHFRFRLLRAVANLIEGNYEGANAILASFRPLDLTEGRFEETRAWCILWETTTLATFRAMSLRFCADRGDGRTPYSTGR